MGDLIFVCTGNTCRSPMAEGLGKKFLNEQWHIASRGLFVSYGQGPNAKSIKAMDMAYIDIRGHVAKQFDIEEITEDTLILTMTSGHKEHLLAYYPRLKGQVFTLLEYVGMKGDVKDPFGADQEVYNQCAALLKKAIQKIDGIQKQAF